VLFPSHIMKNRRRSHRIRMHTVASIMTMRERDPNDQGIGVVVDVSRHGVRLSTGQPPRVGVRVRLRLVIDQDIHTIEGVTRRVVRHKGKGFEVGIEWDDSEPGNLQFLDRFIAAQR
jgi:PilZ domain